MNSKPLYLIRLCLFIVASISAVAPIVAQAEEEKKLKLTADMMHLVTPLYTPDLVSFDPPLGTYVYEVSWQGISAAEASVTIKEEGPFYRIKTKARTFSGIDLFYKMRYRAEGLITALDLMPVELSVHHQENSRISTTEVLFKETGEISSTRARKGKEPESMSFITNNVTLDPFSAAFMARGVEWRLGETKVFDTYNGKSRYFIELTAEDKIQMKVNDEMRDVWVISPKVQKLTEPEASKKLRKASIYLTADKSRDILQIVSSVFIGNVKTKLESFTPESTPSQLAQAQQSFKISFN